MLGLPLTISHIDVSQMQSYPSRTLDRRLQEDWARDVRESPRVFMSLKVDFGPMD